MGHVNARGEGKRPRREPNRNGRAWPLMMVCAVIFGPLTGVVPSTPPAEAAPVAFAGFDLVPVLDAGLVNPTTVRFTNDGKIFVAELAGRVKVFDGFLDPEPDILNLNPDLTEDVHHILDRGLVGLEVHPDFPATPWVWLLYSKNAAPGGEAPRWPSGAGPYGKDACPGGLNGCVTTSALARVVVDPDTNTVTEFHELITDQWCDQHPYHTVGTVLYVDGALFVGAGDGARHNDGTRSEADYGQFGDPDPGAAAPINPCGDPLGFDPGDPSRVDPATSLSGALRAQSSLIRPEGFPHWLNGSVIGKVDPETGHSLVNGAQRTVAVSGDPTGGTFTLTAKGATTTPIAYNATFDEIEAALEPLDTIGNVIGQGGGPLPGTPVLLRFKDTYLDDPAFLTADGGGLTGGTNPAVTVTDTPFWEPIAAGFRNPFRFTDRPGVDELWIGDTGWDTWEEINVTSLSPALGELGRNFGWPCYEGPDRTPIWRDLGNQQCDKMYDLSENDPDPPAEFDAEPPMFSYHNGRTGPDLATCEATGISAVQFYEAAGGGGYPAQYDGSVFFGDAFGGCVFAAQLDAVGVLDPTSVQLVASGITAVDIQPGPDGFLYVVDYANHTVSALVHGVTCPGDDLLKDNDEETTPRVVTPGSFQAVACPDDPDWYAFQVDEPPGDPLRPEQPSSQKDVLVRLETTTDGEDLSLIVRRPNGRGVPGGTSEGNVDSVRFTAGQTGQYRVLVDGAQSRARYTLTIATCDDDHLDNEDADHPQQLTSGGAVLSAVHCPTETAEHYAFSGEAGQTWKLDLTYGERDGLLEFAGALGPDGQPVSPRITGTEGHQHVEIPILETGRYRFSVDGPTPGATIPYTLSLALMTADELCGSGLADAWGNISSPGRAAQPTGWPITANICGPGEQDWFRLDATAFGRITSDLSYDARNPGTLSLELYDSNGGQVAAGQPVLAGDRIRPGRLRLSYIPEHTLDYYLRVTGSPQYGNGHYEDYQLDLIQEPPEPPKATAKLVVRTEMVNGNGGTATAGDFTVRLEGLKGSAPPSGSLTRFPGSESGVTVVVDANVRFVVRQPSRPGYRTGFSGGCATEVPAGQTRTCVITNDYQPAFLTVINEVVNNSGGTAVAADFTLAVGNRQEDAAVVVPDPALASPASFPGAAAPGTQILVTSRIPLRVGVQTRPAGYSTNRRGRNLAERGLSLGQHLTCTITNTYRGATLVVRTEMVNGNGGTATAGDFTVRLEGLKGSAPPSGSLTRFPGSESGVTVVVDANVRFVVRQPSRPGYRTGFSGGCATEVPAGQTRTCVITNDYQPAFLTVINEVVNNSGGTAVAADFTLAVGNRQEDAAVVVPDPALASPASFPGAAAPGTQILVTSRIPLRVGVQTRPAGYSTNRRGCNLAERGLSLGQHLTCTITNDD